MGIPKLVLHLLGPPVLEQDGVAIDVQRRKVMALLIYLAVTGERHSREDLSELLYPGEERTHAGSGFRRTLSLLKSMLSDGPLRTDRSCVWIPAGSGLWVDVPEVHRLIDESHGAERVGDVGAAHGSLASASRLFRGEFLSGFYLRDSPAFDEWQQSEQETLRLKLASVLERLVAINRSLSEYQRAIDYCRQWLALDPLNENVHRHLMRLHCLAGQRAAVFRQYELCRSVLEKELGVPPNTETQQLWQEILSGRLDHPHPQAPHRSPPESESRTRTRRRAAYRSSEKEPHNSIITVLASAPCLPEESEIELDTESERFAQMRELIQSALKQQGCDLIEIVGGEILGMFGAQTPHEDDPDRALNAALQIGTQALLKGLPVSTAVTTGLVHVGNTEGSGHGRSPVKPLVTGKVISSAVRLRMQSEPGEIRLDGATKRSCRRSYVFEEVLGRAPWDIPVFLLHGRSTGSNDQIAARYVTPLVGRGDELQRLHTYLDEAARGHGRVVAVRGEAGIGKSRLIHEFFHKTEAKGDPPILRLRGQCSDFYRNRAAWPFIEALRALVAWREGSEHNHREVVRAFPDEDPREQEDLFHLLSEDFEKIHALKDRTNASQVLMSGRMSVERLARFISRILSVLAKDRTVILVLEDLQWADGISQEIVDHFFSLCEDNPILFLLSSRNGFGPDLSVDHAVSTLVLEPLSADESSRLIRSIVEVAGRRDDIVEQIRSRGKGIPLFLEELSLAAARGSFATKGVPVRVQKIMLSLFGLLPSGQRSLLETASVIGPAFDMKIISKLAGGSASLQRLTMPFAFPVPRHALERYGEEWLSPDHVVTNDPFSISRWDPERERSA